MKAIKVIEIMKTNLKERDRLIIERAKINKRLRDVNKEIDSMHVTIIQSEFEDNEVEQIRQKVRETW